ncbi:DMT family transporter [Arthrobacter sp. USHLN218]|uniref:DMT family transporter n=1 Tax=Arthrobacter sp. USHLN218 TaxID=3081232 RepID=UPI00301624D3
MRSERPRAKPAREGIRLPAPLALGLALLGGSGLAVQSRVTSELGIALQDRLGAALVSFAAGLIAVLAFALLRPAARARLGAVPAVLKRREYPRWWLVAGTIGAFYIFAQAATVGPIGLSLFTIAIVTGQMVSSLAVDRMGLGPGRKIGVSGARVAGAVLAFAAAVVAASAHFAADGPAGPGPEGARLVLLMLIPLFSGLLQSVQQGMLGQMGTVHGSPVISTFLNFAAGTAVLLVLWAAQAALSGRAVLAGGPWWLYLGGPLGALVLASATISVASTGVLLTSLTVICGQLVGSVVLDIAWPSAGSTVGPLTLAGIALTAAAMLIATGKPGAWLRRRKG